MRSTHMPDDNCNTHHVFFLLLKCNLEYALHFWVQQRRKWARPTELPNSLFQQRKSFAICIMCCMQVFYCTSTCQHGLTEIKNTVRLMQLGESKTSSLRSDTVFYQSWYIHTYIHIVRWRVVTWVWLSAVWLLPVKQNVLQCWLL